MRVVESRELALVDVDVGFGSTDSKPLLKIKNKGRTLARVYDMIMT